MKSNNISILLFSIANHANLRAQRAKKSTSMRDRSHGDGETESCMDGDTYQQDGIDGYKDRLQ